MISAPALIGTSTKFCLVLMFGYPDKILIRRGFWPLTMYDKDGFFVDNLINRYNIGDRTPGLKNNTDGSLDIYVSPNNPGQARESNWPPAPVGPFTPLLRMY